MILPPATTYSRIWKATPTIITPTLHSFWLQTERHSLCYSQSYVEFVTNMVTKEMLEAKMIEYKKIDEAYARHT